MHFNPHVEAALPDAMAVAIGEARQADRPFGAVLVDAERGDVVARARNTASSGDPTAHAEINVIRAAGPLGVALDRTILVTTAAPCVMCAGAVIWSRVQGVVVGCGAVRLAELGWPGLVIPEDELMARSPFPPLPWVTGVLEDEVAELYRTTTPPR
ncbi:nucleoside deaminase [Rhizohabitans arisaemae]|uniref:nucleoside deaminase n=1 Tax=Rhizohabitans arisaemae TaxID=2720610 RepID=UPI0024B11983|nr:nucleoside deaminase [Rhizohabitans arisaemae]